MFGLGDTCEASSQSYRTFCPLMSSDWVHQCVLWECVLTCQSKVQAASVHSVCCFVPRWSLVSVSVCSCHPPHLCCCCFYKVLSPLKLAPTGPFVFDRVCVFVSNTFNMWCGQILRTWFKLNVPSLLCVVTQTSLQYFIFLSFIRVILCTDTNQQSQTFKQLLLVKIKCCFNLLLVWWRNDREVSRKGFCITCASLFLPCSVSECPLQKRCGRPTTLKITPSGQEVTRLLLVCELVGETEKLWS